MTRYIVRFPERFFSVPMIRLACRVLALCGWTIAAAYFIARLFPSKASAPGYAFCVNAFCINAMLLSWGVVAYPLSRFRLPEGWFRPRAFESGRFYRRLGVLPFRRVVRSGPIACLLFSGRRGDLTTLGSQMRDAEASHVLIFLVALALLPYALWRGQPGAVPWLLLFNVLLNVYPVMLQRYNRPRLQRLLTLAAPRQNSQL